MPSRNQIHDLRIIFDDKHCDVSADEIRKMESCLDPLRKVAGHFPICDLYITVIHHPRSKDYHVKTSLVLTGRTLFTGDRDTHMYSAFERCVRKLVKKVEGYKASLGQDAATAKHQKGTRQNVLPAGFEPDARELDAAVEAGDYVAFRRALFGYEEPVTKRVGRWINRFPDIEQHLGDTLLLSDVVEEVFLNAFEEYPTRPVSVPIGTWLENLIDPSLKLILKHPDRELENVSFLKTLTATATGTEPAPPPAATRIASDAL